MLSVTNFKKRPFGEASETLYILTLSTCQCLWKLLRKSFIQNFRLDTGGPLALISTSALKICTEQQPQRLLTSQSSAFPAKISGAKATYLDQHLLESCDVVEKDGTGEWSPALDGQFAVNATGIFFYPLGPLPMNV